MPQSDIEAFSSVIPVGRMCTPEDVAGAVAYLVGPDAKFITGVNLQVSFRGRILYYLVPSNRT